MAKYKHVKPDQFYQGLPAGEIDDSTLDVEQQILLGAAVAAGVYEPISEVVNEVPARKSKKDNGDDKSPAEN